MALEQRRAFCELSGLPSPAEEAEDADHASDSSGSEQIKLDPYCVFDRYRDKEDKGKGKGIHG